MVDLIDFEDDFGDLFEEWQWIKHGPQTDNAAGQAVPGAELAPIELWAMPPQPVSESEIIKDVGGEFVRDLQKTYTSENVLTREESTQADILVFGETRFEAYKISDRRSLGTYKKIYLRKLQGDR